MQTTEDSTSALLIEAENLGYKPRRYDIGLLVFGTEE
jgi:hypothetical protein